MNFSPQKTPAPSDALSTYIPDSIDLSLIRQLNIVQDLTAETDEDGNKLHAELQGFEAIWEKLQQEHGSQTLFTKELILAGTGAT